MTPDLTCYGDDIEALADLAGDFDLRSPVDTRAGTREWEAIAEPLGFAQQLAGELAATRRPTWVDRRPARRGMARVHRPRCTDPAGGDRPPGDARSRRCSSR
jgi:hypothetical protein